jgi:hypothetical protein
MRSDQRNVQPAPTRVYNLPEIDSPMSLPQPHVHPTFGLLKSGLSMSRQARVTGEWLPPHHPYLHSLHYVLSP